MADPWRGLPVGSNVEDVNTHREGYRDDRPYESLVLPDPFMTGQARRSRDPTTTTTMPASRHDVIDLTTSPPLAPNRPRQQEVIDLDDVPDTERAGTLEPPLSEDALRRRRVWLLAMERGREAQRHGRMLLEREQRRLPILNTPNFVDTRNLLGEGLASLGARYRTFVRGPNGGGPIRGNAVPQHFLHHGGGLAFVPQLANFQPPDLDYGLFDEAFAVFGDIAAPSAPPTSKYEAPDPCKEPFTRTFTESDVLVCPGCNSELGGVGDDLKRKIFISKCSHVYCGECGHGIQSAAKRQGIVCKAPMCNKRITKTRIFEAYV